MNAIATPTAPETTSGPRALGVVLGLGLVAIVVARAPFSAPEGGHAHLFLAKELALVGLAALAAGLAARSQLALGRDRTSYLLAGLLAVDVVSTIAAKNPYAGLRAITLTLAGALLFLVTRAASRDARTRDLVLESMSAVVALAACSVVAEALGLVALARPKHAPGGLLGERNVAGELLALGLPIAAHAARLRTRRAPVHLATIAVAATAIVLTRTRSAWLAAFVVAAGELVVLARDRHDRDSPRLRLAEVAPLSAGVLGAVIGLVLPTHLVWSSAHPYAETLAALVDPASKSGAGRLVQVATTVRMGLAHPVLGVGPGNWSGAYLAFAEAGDPTIHEGALATNRLANGDISAYFAERGAFGALLAAVLVVELVRAGAEDPRARTTRWALLAALLVVCGLDAVLTTPAALAFVAVGVGALTPAGTDGRAGRLVPALAALTCALATLLSVARLASASRAATARDADARREALALDPGELPGRLLLADELVQNGRCEAALHEIATVRARSSASPLAEELAATCRERAPAAHR